MKVLINFNDGTQKIGMLKYIDKNVLKIRVFGSYYIRSADLYYSRNNIKAIHGFIESKEPPLYEQAIKLARSNRKAGLM